MYRFQIVEEHHCEYNENCNRNQNHGHQKRKERFFRAVASERGLSLAHYQIWLDFIYFDESSILELNSSIPLDPQKIAPPMTSSPNVLYTREDNGTLHKNFDPFIEEGMSFLRVFLCFSINS